MDKRLFFDGRGIGIRTPTGRVRVCSANRYTIPLYYSTFHSFGTFEIIYQQFSFVKHKFNFFDMFFEADRNKRIILYKKSVKTESASEITDAPVLFYQRDSSFSLKPATLSSTFTMPSASAMFSIKGIA